MSELSILTFDPTFSLGEFDVTVSTYKYPLITFRSPNDHTSRHPSLIGPVLIHQRKQFANYLYLTSTMIAFRSGLHHLHAFGTDGEQALVQTCCSQFPKAVHLRCWLHFKDTLMNKLIRDLRLPNNVTQQFISDVMGSPSNLERGLLDAAVQNQVSINIQSASSTMVMPTRISSLPSSTFPAQGPAIMPSQRSTLPSPFVSQQRINKIK